MRTEELIQELSQQGRPVRPLPHPLIRLAVWCVLSLAVMVFGVMQLGVRPNLAPVPPLQVILALALGVSSTALVLVVLSVPGRTSRWLSVVPWVCFAAWAFLICYTSATSGHQHVGVGLKCLRNIAVLSVLPTLLLYAALRAAAPLRASLTGFLAMLGVGAFSFGATSLVCRHSSPVHFLVWHFLPVLALAALGALVGGWVGRGVSARIRP